MTTNNSINNNAQPAEKHAYLGIARTNAYDYLYLQYNGYFRRIRYVGDSYNAPTDVSDAKQYAASYLTGCDNWVNDISGDGWSKVFLAAYLSDDEILAVVDVTDAVNDSQLDDLRCVKIINGKKYATDTAKRICSCRFVNDVEEHTGWEILYQKTTGEFFIHKHYNNDAREISDYDDEVWVYRDHTNDTISPVDTDYAKSFVERFGNYHKYIMLFGEVEE